LLNWSLRCLRAGSSLSRSLCRPDSLASMSEV
jgi:hypothetical protein